MGWNQEQLLEFALTDWLLDSGANVAKKRQKLSDLNALTSAERLLYEFFDSQSK